MWYIDSFGGVVPEMIVVNAMRMMIVQISIVSSIYYW